MKAHLPPEYRLKDAQRQAWEALADEKARKLFHDYDSYTIDIVIASVILTLVKSFGWGTGPNATRIPRLIREIEETIEEYCDCYGHDCAMTALKKQLREYGIEYEGRLK